MSLGNIEFKPQIYIDSEGIEHKGEVVSSGLGRTGYVDWNSGYRSRIGVKSARLIVAAEHIDIRVEPGNRNQGIGSELLSAVVDRCAEQGLDRLVVLGATEIAKPFYDKAFAKLQLMGTIRQFSSEPREVQRRIVDYIFDVNLK